MTGGVWPLPVSLILFPVAAAVITFAGVRLSAVADRLADRTGLGEAFVGAVFLGASTSLPGITASVTAAWNGFASLAMANALGGIAVQTAFLAVADVVYRKANLEHAAASVGNMMWGALLVILLAGMLVAMLGPPVTWYGVHPVSPLLLFAYVMGTRWVAEAHEHPMWRPRMTRATRVDKPDSAAAKSESLGRLWAVFALAALVVVVAGWGVTRAGESLAVLSGLSQSLIGGVLVAVTTSLPELVTSVAAVRRGALTLAVGGVLGGNAFDTLFAALADVAYRGGSIYHETSQREPALAALTILMCGTLLLGLLRRERVGPVGIGSEGLLILVLYLLGTWILGSGG